MNCNTHIFEVEQERIHLDSFTCFLSETNPVNKFVSQETEAGWPARIAATGVALASYPVAFECGFAAASGINPRSLPRL